MGAPLLNKHLNGQSQPLIKVKGVNGVWEIYSLEIAEWKKVLVAFT